MTVCSSAERGNALRRSRNPLGRWHSPIRHELADLVRDLRRDLAGFGPTVSGAENRITDAPTAVLKVRTADGELRSVSAYALGLVDGYPRSLVEAQRRMRQLAERVMREGDGYTSNRVRLVAEERLSDPADTVQSWPVDVPLPAATPSILEGVRWAC